jgi:hypothetical protein
MTTATIQDEQTGDYRPLTEDEVRKLQEDAFDNGNTTVAEQEAAEAAFKAIVDSYLQVRGRVDPEWRTVHVPETDYEDADWDFLGSWVSVEWKEYDRCGDREYLRRDFPLEHLWHPNWEEVIKAEVEVRDAAEKAKQAAFQASQAAKQEAYERKQLAELLNKYGVPKAYQARLDHD